MKQVSAEVLNLDVQKLIEMLNAALCEEWLAYYQYWVGARVTEGPMRSEIESEMLKHARRRTVARRQTDRSDHPARRHARAQPRPMDEKWPGANTKRRPTRTSKPFSNRICAANAVQSKRYQDIADFTSGIDYTTAKMAVEILEDELEHEQDIISFQRDITSLKKDARQNDEIKQPGYGQRESRYLRDSLSCCRNCGAAGKIS